MQSSTAAQPGAMILVVDDDPSVRRSLSRLLRSFGHGVETFERAEDLLAQSLPDRPCCAVLDVNLPGMSGLDLQRSLTAISATLPIVFITGQGDIPLSVRAMKAGAVDFLPKPFEDRELLRAVEEALQRHTVARAAAGERAEVSRRFALLSRREAAVMQLVVAGLPNKQVGSRLSITRRRSRPTARG